MTSPESPTVAIVTLGCARNEVDSEELAAGLARDGWRLVDDPEQADTVMVNTCGFIESAKRDSIDAVMAATDLPGKVVAVGCMAQRYGQELATAMPEADAVLGFDAYPDLPTTLRRVLAGERVDSHIPVDRRHGQPKSPALRDESAVVLPGHIGMRQRLEDGPRASVKLASGCDRRCTFCAIPSFRGAFVSRRPTDVIAEVAWLVGSGVREVNLVSENSTSYGKDFGDLRLLEAVLGDLAAVDGLARARVAYLQPAEMRPGLVDVIATTPGVAPYFDLSFQHASSAVLRRMRRFGGADEFLRLIDSIRAANPDAGIRSNFIAGFPGETEAEFEELLSFLADARLDAIGVFGYSDEEGTEAVELPGHLPQDVVDERVSALAVVADDIMTDAAASRVGTSVEILVTGPGIGVTAQQGPEDGETTLRSDRALKIGDVVQASVVDSDGPDLVATVN